MRVLILSDIHGNYEALKTVLEKAGNVDEIIVLGDLVDYGPDPDLVIDELRSLGARIVRGNHDHAVAFNTDCKCGEKTRELSILTRRKISLVKLSKTDLSLLRSLPVTLELPLGEITIKCFHASPLDPLYDYVHPWSVNRILETKNALNKQKVICIGHTHLQFHVTWNGIRVINPGSTGQPRDGDWRASFAVLSIKSHGIEVNLQRVKYDVEKTVKKLKELGLEDRSLSKLTSILLTGRV